MSNLEIIRCLLVLSLTSAFGVGLWTIFDAFISKTASFINSRKKGGENNGK